MLSHRILHNHIFTIFLIFQCPPSAANTTHVSGNFAQDYIWYILRTKVETWESFVYHNFYFCYFLSLAKTASFLHHQQPDNLNMRDTAAYMSPKLFHFSRVSTMMAGFNRQHCQTTYYPPWIKDNLNLTEGQWKRRNLLKTQPLSVANVLS